MRMMKAEDAMGPSHRVLWSLQTLPRGVPPSSRPPPSLGPAPAGRAWPTSRSAPVSHLCPSSTQTLSRPHPLLLFFCSHPVVFAEIQGIRFRCAVRMMPCDLPKDTIHTGVEVRVLVWRREKVKEGETSQRFVVVQSLSRVRLFETAWTAARQASLSFTVSQSLPKLMSIESVMPSNHLILCRPLLLLPSIFPSIKVFFQWVGSSHQVAKVLNHLILHLFWNPYLESMC